MTLNGAQNLGDKAKGNNPIFVSALTPGATPGITNYYNKEALDLYLKARTNLLLTTRTYLMVNILLIKMVNIHHLFIRTLMAQVI